MISDRFRLLKEVDGVRCAKCAQFIWSRSRHDYQTCGCGNTFVDGGRDYLRYGARFGVPDVERYDLLIEIGTDNVTLLPCSELNHEPT